MPSIFDPKPPTDKYKPFVGGDKSGRSSATTGKSATGQYNSGAAPRVGGAAAKATTVYTGKGASKGASRLKKAGTGNASVKRAQRTNKKRY